MHDLLKKKDHDPPALHSQPPLQRLLTPVFLIKLDCLCLMILIGWFFLGGAVTCFISSRRQRD